MTWIEFVDAARALSAGSAAPGWDAEAYLGALGALAARLDRSDPALRARFEALERSGCEDYAVDTAHECAACRILLVVLAPGGGVGLHDHDNESGLILCCEGAVAVEAFDRLGGAPARLRRAARETLAPGGQATLTRARGNIHRLDSAGGAWLVDVFAPPPITCRPYALGEALAPGVFAIQPPDAPG